MARKKKDTGILNPNDPAAPIKLFGFTGAVLLGGLWLSSKASRLDANRTFRETMPMVFEYRGWNVEMTDHKPMIHAKAVRVLGDAEILVIRDTPIEAYNDIKKSINKEEAS